MGGNIVNMPKPKIIRKVALSFFRDKKLLMVRSENQQEVFYSLGGTVEAGESDEQCLVREVLEEVGCEVDKASLKFMKEFEDVAHGRKNTLVNIRVYEGDLLGEPQPSSEIVEIAYFDSSVDPKHLSQIAKTKIFPWLKEKGYVN